jgi:gamma-glutamylcyclotransferase (GGCT)/AIG2-like uncharacterized protein YtfP
MHLYFAYGSNMSPVQMEERCPGAESMGAVRLDGWRFVITTFGTANIVQERHAHLHGVLWRCTDQHLATLDEFEGVRVCAYLRRDVTVLDTSGVAHAAIAYVSGRPHPGKGRIDYMLTAVLPGARHFSLPPAYVCELESWLPDGPHEVPAERYRGRRY